MMRQIGFNVKMTNRMRIGLTGGYFGGRGSNNMEKYALGAADFPHSTAQELDDFIPPTGEDVEAKPRFPSTWDDWLRRCRSRAVAQ